MNVVRRALGLLVSVGLAAGQMSGVHAHLDAHGFSGTPRGAHVHAPLHREHVRAPASHHAHDAHDAPDDGHPQHSAAHQHDANDRSHGTVHEDDPTHSGERDVAVTKLTVVPFKVIIAFVVTFSLVLALVLVPTRVVTQFAIAVALRPGRWRWRPPLRAPPLALAR